MHMKNIRYFGVSIWELLIWNKNNEFKEYLVLIQTGKKWYNAEKRESFEN